jgi:hypothetical protein
MVMLLDLGYGLSSHYAWRASGYVTRHQATALSITAEPAPLLLTMPGAPSHAAEVGHRPARRAGWAVFLTV